MQDKEVSLTLGLTRKSLEATLVYACPHCGAPGVYKSDEYHKEFYPGCWDPKIEQGASRPVGDTCPNCKGKRKPNLYKGELSGSMPKWVWQIILAFKWCLIKVLTVRRRLFPNVTTG